GKLVARACDSFGSYVYMDKTLLLHMFNYINNRKIKFNAVSAKLPKAEPNYLERIIDESQTHKARLLHYFPIQRSNQRDDVDDSWCGWHVDHSSLTGNHVSTTKFFFFFR